MTTDPVTVWTCSCGERRETPFKFVGPGAPGCAKCSTPMTRLGDPAPAGAQQYVPAPTRPYVTDDVTKQRPALLLLLDRLEADPNPQRQKLVLVSEYTWSVAQAARDCVDDLQKLFPAK